MEYFSVARVWDLRDELVNLYVSIVTRDEEARADSHFVRVPRLFYYFFLCQEILSCACNFDLSVLSISILSTCVYIQ